ncbi:MAG: OmpA family protein [Pseudobacteriovorax sp.]|nr:OmpA family protein [Pseudobacteriovorax sp.]
MSDDGEEEEGGGAGWIVSYADLMTLLFAAFVVLYGITPQGKSEEIIGIAISIREAFIEIPDEIPEEFRVAELFQGKLSFKEAIRDTTINPAIKKFNRTENIYKGRNKEQTSVEIILEKIGNGEGVYESLRKATRFSKDEYGFSLKLLGKGYFNQNSYRLSRMGKETVQNIAKRLLETQETIVIEGHADIRTSGQLSPLELSIKRARAIKQEFTSQGIESSRIQITGLGALRPKDNKNPELNERVEIKTMYYGARTE